MDALKVGTRVRWMTRDRGEHGGSWVKYSGKVVQVLHGTDRVVVTSDQKWDTFERRIGFAVVGGTVYSALEVVR